MFGRQNSDFGRFNLLFGYQATDFGRHPVVLRTVGFKLASRYLLLGRQMLVHGIDIFADGFEVVVQPLGDLAGDVTGRF